MITAAIKELTPFVQATRNCHLLSEAALCAKTILDRIEAYNQLLEQSPEVSAVILQSVFFISGSMHV
jgi:hypothetical protein